MNEKLDEACDKFARGAASMAEGAARELRELVGRRSVTAPKSTTRVVPERAADQVLEAGQLLKGLFRVARDAVKEITVGTGRQVAHGLMTGASLLAPPGIVSVGRVPQGGSVDVPVFVDNTTDAPLRNLSFRSSPLVAPGTRTIPAENVTATPAEVDVDAGGECALSVKIRVAPKTPVGRYVGSIVGSIDDGREVLVQATIVVDVV